MVKAARKAEGEMKEKHITESNTPMCMVYLTACSIDRNVFRDYWPPVQKMFKNPSGILSIFCYCLDQFTSQRQRITRKFSPWRITR